MPVNIDAPRSAGPAEPAGRPAPGSASRPRTRLWWLVPEVLAVIVLAALLPTGVGGPRDARAELGRQVAVLLEQASPAEHHDHGHEVTAEDKVFCEAEVIGTDPPGTADTGEVRTVYANYFCAAGRPGMDYEYSSRASGPVVVQLRQPPLVQVPAAGEGYEQRVRELLPDEYEGRALGAALSPEVAGQVKRRYLAAFPA